MKRRITALALAAGTLALATGASCAEDEAAERPVQDERQAEATAHDEAAAALEEQRRAETEAARIYGYDLMSVEERNAYREKLDQVESGDARREFVAEHREAMRLRARAQEENPTGGEHGADEDSDKQDPDKKE